MPILRDKRGRILPGSSGISPGSQGRPKGVKARAREAMDSCGIHPLKFLTNLLEDKKATNKDRLTAAGMLLDRGWGKAQQYIDLETNQVDIVIKGPEKDTK